MHILLKRTRIWKIYLLVPTGCHKVFAVGAPVTWPDDPAVHGCVLPRVCVQGELGLCNDTTNTQHLLSTRSNTPSHRLFRLDAGRQNDLSWVVQSLNQVCGVYIAAPEQQVKRRMSRAASSSALHAAELWVYEPLLCIFPGRCHFRAQIGFPQRACLYAAGSRLSACLCTDTHNHPGMYTQPRKPQPHHSGVEGLPPGCVYIHQHVCTHTQIFKGLLLSGISYFYFILCKIQVTTVF